MYMKKRTILITILLVVSLALSACDSLGLGSKKSSKKSTKVEKEDEDDEKKDKKGKKGSSEEDIDEWKEEASEAAISDFLDLMNDDEYFSAVLASFEANEIIEDCRDAQISYDKVYVVDFSEGNIASVMNSSSNGKFEYDDLSDAAKERLASGLANTLSISASHSLGVDYLAALSVMSTGKSFAVDYDFEDQLWIYDTDVLDFAIVVFFHNNHEGVVAVTVSGYFYNGALEYALEDTLDEFGLSYDIVEK